MAGHWGWGEQQVPMGLTVIEWGCRWTASPSDSLALAHKYVTVVFGSHMDSSVPLKPMIFPKLRNI